ncbi:hypothetical protein HYQ45_000451 [Verticillium longisporum]|uniref:Ribosomal protein S21 n=1 Tax=Verticillium longisporum TaxID=100787 RepID=A0A8I3AXR5_VERLO|nr:hypothetical protein HYQ45_000451 [Verticillium longisporum]
MILSSSLSIEHQKYHLDSDAAPKLFADFTTLPLPIVVACHHGVRTQNGKPPPASSRRSPLEVDHDHPHTTSPLAATAPLLLLHRRPRPALRRPRQADLGSPHRPLPDRERRAAAPSAASDHVYDATSTDTLDLSKIIAAESDDFLRSHYRAPKPELRLKPVLGRTIHCTARLDMAGALIFLGKAMRANNTKELARLQKRHERPGLKRKRLRSERWRARFKIGFAATVSRVQELRNQGW